MEAIKCPNCGSEKCQEVTEEKWICLACDNVFLIHNLSKEFKKTDKHLTEVHQDLKEGIQKIMDGNLLNEKAVLEKAEEHLKKKDYALAYKFFTQVAEEFPQHAAGWYGRYRALTGDFTQVKHYARFVCEGNYVDLEEGAERTKFEGLEDIKKALSCEDADEKMISEHVTSFLKECAEYGKKDIEESIVSQGDAYTDIADEVIDTENGICREQKKALVKAMLPVIPFGIAVLILVSYVIAADWLGKIIGVVLLGGFLKFGGKRVINRIRLAREKRSELADSLNTYDADAAERADEVERMIKYYCTDLDNYQLVLEKLSDKEQFVQNFINNDPLAQMADYEEPDDDFILDLAAGRIEKYAYLSRQMKS